MQFWFFSFIYFGFMVSWVWMWFVCQSSHARGVVSSVEVWKMAEFYEVGLITISAENSAINSC